MKIAYSIHPSLEITNPVPDCCRGDKNITVKNCLGRKDFIKNRLGGGEGFIWFTSYIITGSQSRNPGRNLLKNWSRDHGGTLPPGSWSAAFSFFFWDRVSLYRPHCPETRSVDQVGCKLSASWVPALKDAHHVQPLATFLMKLRPPISRDATTQRNLGPPESISNQEKHPCLVETVLHLRFLSMTTKIRHIALANDLGPVPGTHTKQLTAVCNSRSRDSFSGLPRYLHTVRYTYSLRYTHKFKKEILKFPYSYVCVNTKDCVPEPTEPSCWPWMTLLNFVYGGSLDRFLFSFFLLFYFIFIYLDLVCIGGLTAYMSV